MELVWFEHMWASLFGVIYQFYKNKIERQIQGKSHPVKKNWSKSHSENRNMYLFSIECDLR